MHPSEEAVKERVRVALAMVCHHDRQLFDSSVGEWSIAFRLGVYLIQQFPEYDVDCEYNRAGDDPKKRPDGSLFRPDIVIHQRGCNSRNLLVIEIKRQGNNKDGDRAKLKEMTSKTGSLRYAYGLSLRFNALGRVPTTSWFVDGSN
jgi:hypothetical protein